MKIIFFGSSSPLSFLPFQQLLASTHEVIALVTESGAISDFPVVESGSIHELAILRDIKILSYDCKDFETLLSEYQADIIVVSCFSRILPASVFSLPRYGAINIHPSLLPAFRGPDPLFWQYRAGAKVFGITLHRLCEKIDAGDILAQKQIKLADGILVEIAKQQLGKLAAGLLIETLHKLLQVDLPPIKQDETQSSYQSWPETEDYSISSDWTGVHITNFISAYRKSGIYFSCKINNKIFRISDITAIKPLPGNLTAGEVVEYNGEVIEFSCKDSLLECRLYRG